MLRTVIEIDEEKCTGCGQCVLDCHEGAIEIVNGKAKLARENFCDGFGDCLKGCPFDAIRFIEKDAPAYDEKAVERAKKIKELLKSASCTASEETVSSLSSDLTNWPVQIKLAPLKSDAFENCDLLIAADCTAFSYRDFHRDFIKGRTVLVGCPKLDMTDYSEKLSDIIRANQIKSIHIVRMEVPCCSGLMRAVEDALKKAGKDIPVSVTVITSKGEIR
ncbi:MAG: 4Fe-4S binding protein [Clostridia bacterium]|nr:4Fe-4S binding protein [Clostridia bacterium]